MSPEQAADVSRARQRIDGATLTPARRAPWREASVRIQRWRFEAEAFARGGVAAVARATYAPTHTDDEKEAEHGHDD